jgi:hypothetical protein
MSSRGGAVRDIGVVPQVVTNKPPARTRQLQQERRNQRKPDEHVPRHQRMNAENDRPQLDRDRHDKQQPDSRGQPPVAIRIGLADWDAPALRNDAWSRLVGGQWRAE